MNRDIKFRAFDNDEAVMKMVYSDSEVDNGDYYFKVNDNKVVCMAICLNCDICGEEVTEWEPLDNIMEFTGEKDRINHKEIYEGDIIKALHRNYDNEDDKEKYFETFKVTYLNGCFMFGNWNAHEFLNKFIYTEVIGNIFENPELVNK